MKRILFILILAVFMMGKGQFFSSNELEDTENVLNSSHHSYPDPDPDQGVDGTPNPGEDPVPIDEYVWLLPIVAFIIIRFELKRYKTVG